MVLVVLFLQEFCLLHQLQIIGISLQCIVENIVSIFSNIILSVILSLTSVKVAYFHLLLVIFVKHQHFCVIIEAVFFLN